MDSIAFILLMLGTGNKAKIQPNQTDGRPNSTISAIITNIQNLSRRFMIQKYLTLLQLTIERCTNKSNFTHRNKDYKHTTKQVI